MIKNDENEQSVVTDNNAERSKVGPFNNKMYFVIFWVVFFVLIVLITVKCVVDLTNVNTLNGAFASKEYTSSDVEALTTALKSQLEDENKSLHTAYRMDMKLLSNYQVYTGEDGKTAMVIYTVEFKNKNYTVIGYTHSYYFNGLNSIFEYRNELIRTGNYTWDNSYIPEEDEVLPEITPTEPPTHTEDGTPISPDIDDTDEVIERGGGEEE